MDKDDSLRDLDVIAELSSEDLELLRGHSVTREYAKGTMITFPGDRARFVYYVLRGRVKIFDLAACGREIIFRLCGPKSFFGIAEIFGHDERLVYAQATEPTEVTCIEKPTFELLIQSNPTVALGVIRILGQRVRQAHRAIKGFVFSDARARVAQILVKLAQIDGQRDSQGTVALKSKLTHQEIADMIGASRQTVTEIVNDLKREGLITINQGRITIRNLSDLEHFTES